ncbi:tetratricopeptide repeat protein [Rivularia sp. PCC 7116]|uniref:tetratricopeptide repeat protein n=1 Tax=Rivularia sp. PCC 7116 TaxID=373994 RepID=UPI0035298D4A
MPKIGNPNFVGRINELVKVHEELYQHKNNRVAISAVSGMGGVGKTELAIQYARKYYDDYSGGICWLNVRDTNLAAEIIQFIQQKMRLEVPQKDIQENPLTLEEQVAWCWQNWQPPQGLVLVILDDVTEYKEIKKLLPRTDNQRFKLLITTRQRGLDTNLVDITLDILSEDEALSLLRGILGEEDKRIDKELETAKDLCKWLGYLPLGLELVGRYLVEDADLSIADMLEELQEERLNNEAINPESDDLENTEMTARLGVQAAFNLTWEKLEKKTREVGELLSLFNPNEIAWEYVESVSESLSWKKKDVKNAKKLLHGRNVIKRLEEGEASYQIHPLIREFLKVKLQASVQANEFKQAFTDTFIEIGETISKTPTLEFRNSVKNAIPHFTEVLENHLDGVSDENLYWAFYDIGRFYQEQGLYALAQPWYEQCLSTVRSRLGENHPDFGMSLNKLAAIYQCQGKYSAAEPLFIQALQLIKQQLGQNHSRFAVSLNYLARLYSEQGKYSAAEPLFIQALQLTKQLLGKTHPRFALGLNNLASLYESQGKYEQAEPLYIEALESYEQQLGKNHTLVAQCLNNLAYLYNKMGRYEQAEPLYIQALQLRKQLLGENHPSYANSLNNLACLYDNQGKHEQAEPLYIQALQLRKQLLGENHPHTASSINNLACLYYNQGKYEQAEPLYIQALELRKQLLGINHPHTATSLNNLALLYSNQGKYEQAESLCIQALQLRKKLFGENHPDTASIFNNLACLYDNQGKYEKAEPLYIQALQLTKQLQGENHPDTAGSLNNLAYFYKNMGKYEQAEPLYIQALEIVEQIFGETHPDTVLYRNNLEYLREKKGESEG